MSRSKLPAIDRCAATNNVTKPETIPRIFFIGPLLTNRNPREKRLVSPLSKMQGGEPRRASQPRCAPLDTARAPHLLCAIRMRECLTNRPVPRPRNGSRDIVRLIIATLAASGFCGALLAETKDWPFPQRSPGGAFLLATPSPWRSRVTHFVGAPPAADIGLGGSPRRHGGHGGKAEMNCFPFCLPSVLSVAPW